MLVRDEDEHDVVVLEELSTIEDSAISGSSGIPEVSMHALSSHISLRTIRVKDTINYHFINILINNGSTHNFIQ